MTTPPSPDAHVYRGVLSAVAVVTGLAAIYTSDPLYLRACWGAFAGALA